MECKITNPLWKYFDNWYATFGIEASFSIRNIIFNTVCDNRFSVYNFLVLIIKFYIYKCKCARSPPSIKGLENEIESVYQIEFYNAKQKGRVDKHVRKWKPIRPTYHYYWKLTAQQMNVSWQND